MSDQPVLTSLHDLTERLQELHQRTRETPLFNPVFQLSLDISRKLEKGEMDIAALSGLVDELEGRSLEARAERLRNLLAPEDAEARLSSAVRADENFEAYRAFWARLARGAFDSGGQ